MPHTVHANGAEIPALGLGTWAMKGGECRAAVSGAVAAGYRHVDTARMYENEDAVGDGIRDSGVPRDQVFVTTKIWPDDHAPDDLVRATETALRALRFDHVDLLLLHWPSRHVPIPETIGALNRVREQGKARHIGLSNFTTRQIAEAQAASAAPLVTNQVEYHPYLDQTAVLRAVRDAGMALTAYMPLGRATVLEEPVVLELAAAHGRPPAQIVLRWLIQQPQVVAIPKTSSPVRAISNLAAADFMLSAEEMAALHRLARPDGRMCDYAGLSPEWDRA